MVNKPRDVPGVGCIQRKRIVQTEDVAPVTVIGKFTVRIGGNIGAWCYTCSAHPSGASKRLTLDSGPSAHKLALHYTLHR
jgi:hypothetical protein